MQILGLQKTTLLDYPGNVASTIFLGGCNMRCPFCHNMNLVMGESLESYTVEDILSFLQKRKGVIDGVCITGGEPTINYDLLDFIRNIHNLGLKVKLDTNGTNPTMLEQLITEHLVDYVAMDIKSATSNYSNVCGIADISIDNIVNSIQILINSGIDYEFRTTLIREYHNEAVIRDIAIMLDGASNYYLQSFIDSPFVIDHSLNAIDKNTLMEYQEILSKHIAHVDIRGVE